MPCKLSKKKEEEVDYREAARGGGRGAPNRKKKHSINNNRSSRGSRDSIRMLHRRASSSTVRRDCFGNKLVSSSLFCIVEFFFGNKLTSQLGSPSPSWVPVQALAAALVGRPSNNHAVSNHCLLHIFWSPSFQVRMESKSVNREIILTGC